MNAKQGDLLARGKRDRHLSRHPQRPWHGGASRAHRLHARRAVQCGPAGRQPLCLGPRGRGERDLRERYKRDGTIARVDDRPGELGPESPRRVGHSVRRRAGYRLSALLQSG